MTFRAGRALLILTTVLLAACGSERATAPRGDLALQASVNAGVPAPLSAWPASNVAIGLSWPDNSTNESGFEVHRSTTGEAGNYTLAATTAANAKSYEDGSRQPATKYCYKVRAVRAKGNSRPTYSDFSNIACATTYGPPPAPASIDAKPLSYSGISISWSASPTATAYRLYRSTTGSDPWERVDGDIYGTSYDDWGPSREQRYCYRVVAFNTWGESSPIVDCTAIPIEPSGLSATALPKGGGVDLVWTDESDFEDGYDVQRAGSDFNFTTIATLPLGTEQYHDPLTADGEWWYRVRAMKDGGYSVSSNYARAVVANTPPAAPSNLRVHSPSSTTTRMYWQDNATNETEFGVERSVAGGEWTLAGTTGWNGDMFDDVGLVAEQEACYRVYAKNDAGESARSAPDCMTPMAAPTNLVATTSAVAGAVDLTWDDVSNAESGYEVSRYYCIWTGYYYGWVCDYYVVAERPAGSTSWREEGLNPGESYSYLVTAFRDRPGIARSRSNSSNESSAAAGQP